MNKGDLLVERGAERLQHLADRAAARGDGVGEWLSEELRSDAAFLRKLKPSLIQARAKGNAPTNQEPAAPPPRRRDRSSDRGPSRRRKSARAARAPHRSLIVGAALVAGIVLAKVVDWRGHAHPRD